MATTATAQVTPFLPTAQQIRAGGYPGTVASQLEQLSLRILQRHLAPLVLRWQGRRARRVLLHATLASLPASRSGTSDRGDAEAQVQLAANSAVCFTSAIGQAMASLGGGGGGGAAAAEDEGGEAVGPAGRTGGRSSGAAASRPPRASLSSASAVDGGGVRGMTEKEGLDGADPVDGAAGGGGAREERAGVTAMTLSPDSLAAGAAAAPLAHPSLPSPPPPRPLSAGQQREAEGAKASIRAALRDHMTLRTHLQAEHIQWLREPGHEVLLLLAGSLRRRYPLVGPAGGSASGGGGAEGGSGSPILGGGGGGGRPGSPRFGGSVRSGEGGSTAVSTRATTPTGRTRQGGLRAATRRGSQFQYAQQQQHPIVAGSSFAVDVLEAPLVLGELATLGGFPFCEELVVESERCLVASVPKEAYCALVARLPSRVQKRLLVAALQQRERLLPFFAPMTPGRLRLCPLLSSLGKEELRHLQDHLVPKVFAAGMVCSENTDPQHIFFIRRGLVRMEREGSANVENGASTSPKNRTLFVDGQTFGETPCIFRESLGDVFYALSHVDAYLLPFRVLIQLMKQQPEVQSVVYKCARATSVLREKDFDGVLRFNPGVGDVYGLQGVASRRSSLFGRVTGAHGSTSSRRQSSLTRANSSVAGGPGGLAGGSVHFTLTPSPSGAVGGSRHVTIFEEGVPPPHPQQTGAGGGLFGGKVSAALVTAMRQIPLLSLVAPREAMEDAERHWRCVRYEKGDVIARRGEECNRVLLFYEGRAGIVLDENALRHEMRPTVFGVADLAVLASAQDGQPFNRHMGEGEAVASGAGAAPASAGILQAIPAGHAVGYTCVLRHRWTRTILAVDDNVEVWELSRVSLVHVLRQHGLERHMWTAVGQLLEPLVPQPERFFALDYQPLCRPMPSSLWGEQPIVNVHPVRLAETSAFPVWREGDFPLDRVALEGGK